ncbi:MAG: hypothetical protein GY874_23585 [Desulfobacteraceae bacterium]|nr:hypothetical protein [Desulfobacteraceae bacterium]
MIPINVDLDSLHEKALNLALNKINGEWDFDRLTGLLREFEEVGDFDIEFTGFDMLESTELTQVKNMDVSDLINDNIFEDTPAADSPQENKKGKPVIQYTIIFNDEDEQNKWHRWLRSLKGKHPDAATISERIVIEIDEYC